MCNYIMDEYNKVLKTYYKNNEKNIINYITYKNLHNKKVHINI